MRPQIAVFGGSFDPPGNHHREAVEQLIKEFDRAALALAVILATSAILKFTWYDHLAVREVETDKAAAGDK